MTAHDTNTLRGSSLLPFTTSQNITATSSHPLLLRPPRTCTSVECVASWSRSDRTSDTVPQLAHLLCSFAPHLHRRHEKKRRSRDTKSPLLSYHSPSFSPDKLLYPTSSSSSSSTTSSAGAEKRAAFRSRDSGSVCECRDENRMFNTRVIPADHKDLVHDVSYDFYGKRFATCSSDQFVKIWDKDSDDQWYCSASFKAHTGSVWRVTWAHPEFGQIIATCSFDRTVAIWEEKLSSPPASPSRLQQQQQQQQSSSSATASLPVAESKWVKRALLVDSRSSITDVKFAPKHLGLLLATCSSDGTVRIYEAPDIMNLSQWNPQNDLNCKMSCSCLSWNPSPFHAPMIAVGSDEPADPSSTSSLNNLSHEPSSSSFFTSRSTSGSNTAVAAATSSVPLGRVLIYESGENSRKWFLVEVIARVCEPVHDLAFACSVGRDYHLLAVASSDVKILTLKDISNHAHRPQHALIDSSAQSNTRSSSPIPKYEIQQIAKFDDHATRVWRLSWNLTGTILASSGGDGRVRLWKSNYLDSWKSIGVIKMDGSGVAGTGAAHPVQCSGQRLATSRS